MNKFAELCSSRYFVIPENQRGFSWGKRQLEDIINDLTLAGNESHYMGPVIVTRTEEPDFADDDLSTTAEFFLEDGQQRLTAFFIMANEIMTRLIHLNGVPDIESKEIERLVFYKKDGLQLRLKNYNSDLDQYYSFIIKGTPAPPANRTPPMEAMDIVRHYVREFLSDKDRSQLLHWKNKISNSAKFILVDLAKEGVNRYLAFDAINSRGLPLSEFDKIKNFCILVNEARSLNISAEDSWYRAITQLQKFGVSSRSDEAAYITDIYRAFHGELVGRKEVHAKFVAKYRRLLTKPNPALESDLKSFIGFWEEYAKSFGFITTSTRSPYYRILCTKIAGDWLDRLV